MPGITFPTSAIQNYDEVQRQLARAGCKWALHEISLENDLWTNEIVALETNFTIRTAAKYTDLDKSGLLCDFMKFILRTCSCVIRLIVDAQVS